MMRHALKRLLRRINEESPVTGQPVYNHPRISRENSFFSRLISKPGCNHNYAWGVLQAAVLAKSLDHSRISVIEFGVAGGNGLVALEKISEVVSAHYAVHIDV